VECVPFVVVRMPFGRFVGDSRRSAKAKRDAGAKSNHMTAAGRRRITNHVTAFLTHATFQLVQPFDCRSNYLRRPFLLKLLSQLENTINISTSATMTDSPIVRIPLDPKEQPILDSLLAIRTKLELLKQDKSTYVKSQDVFELYDEVIAQVESLNQIRTTKRLEQNRGESLSSRIASDKGKPY
jgi:hypothetical protein